MRHPLKGGGVDLPSRPTLPRPRHALPSTPTSVPFPPVRPTKHLFLSLSLSLYLVTSAMAAARRSTLAVVTPAMEMRPSCVR